MTVALRTRPSAETFPLDDLVTWAWQGRIRIPSFQRGLRWSQRDVVRLFDSILNGFPIGSLLFWQRQAPAEEVILGPLRITADHGDAYYVVDGQQRITALAAALHPEGGGDPRFQVGYDLGSAQFTPRPSHESGGFVPAPVLYDLTKLLGWFRERPQLEERFDDAAVSKILRDLRIPAYVVRQDDEDVLRTIFDRMNTAGKKLTRGEVFAALHRPAGRAGELSLGDVSEQIQARTGFGRLEDGLTMQLVLARRGAQTSCVRSATSSTGAPRVAIRRSRTRPRRTPTSAAPTPPWPPSSSCSGSVTSRTWRSSPTSTCLWC